MAAGAGLTDAPGHRHAADARKEDVREADGEGFLVHGGEQGLPAGELPQLHRQPPPVQDGADGFRQSGSVPGVVIAQGDQHGAPLSPSAGSSGVRQSTVTS